MGKILFLLIFILTTHPSFSRAEDLIHFSIEKSTYENLSASQKENINLKIFELNTFFIEEVFTHIPPSILNRIQDLNLTINFNDNSERNGLFIPDPVKGNKIIIQLIQLNSNGLKALLAHEFFHAVQNELNPNEFPWIREGLAQVFEYIVTGELNGNTLRAAINNPLTPLIGQYDIDNPNAAQYGHDMLYFYYLYKHCGEDQIFWDITQGLDGLKGSDLINAVLKRNKISKNECHNFPSSVLSFEISKNHNQMQFNNEETQEEFFLLPSNITPKYFTPNSQKELTMAIASMPTYSTLFIRYDVWNNFIHQYKNSFVVYSQRSFPYVISTDQPDKNAKNYDVIIVKIPDEKVLTDVSLKNTRK